MAVLVSVASPTNGGKKGARRNHADPLQWISSGPPLYVALLIVAPRCFGALALSIALRKKFFRCGCATVQSKSDARQDPRSFQQSRVVSRDRRVSTAFSLFS